MTSCHAYEDEYRTEYALCMEEVMRERIEKSETVTRYQQRLAELREIRHRDAGRITDREYKSQREALLSWTQYFRRRDAEERSCQSCHNQPAVTESYGIPVCHWCAMSDTAYWLGDLLYAIGSTSQKGA